MAVIGSAFMATSLSDDSLVRLLVNALATTLALFVAISVFASISGAHFNPVVTLVFAIENKNNWSDVILYILAQFSGGVFGVFLANLMFQGSVLKVAGMDRADLKNYLGEIIATSILVMLILISVTQNRAHTVAYLVPAWIGSAYFTTVSTSFANPAVTFARTFSDNGAGINPQSMGIFIAVQLAGGLLGLFLSRIFMQRKA